MMKVNDQDNISVTEYCNQRTKRIVGVSILLVGCFIIVFVAIFTFDLVYLFNFTVPFVLNQYAKCEVPSISTGQLHVIVAGHDNVKLSDYEQFTGFGLSNTTMFPYIRHPEMTFVADIGLPCGMQLHPRYILPNHGRDAAAFFDYAIEHYHNPPELLVFLHGHMAVSEHTTCISTFSRLLLAYRMLARGGDLNRMVTLTAKPFKDSDPYEWFGKSKTTSSRWFWKSKTTSSRRLEPSLEEAACHSLLASANITVRGNGRHMNSCCASFILPGARLSWYPLSFYRSLKTFMVNTTLNDQLTGRFCFEFIIYNLFSENYSSEQDLADERSFYEASKNLVRNEPSLKNRLAKCHDKTRELGRSVIEE